MLQTRMSGLVSGSALGDPGSRVTCTRSSDSTTIVFIALGRSSCWAASQAGGSLTSGRLAEALDLSQAYPAVLARYTAPEPSRGVQDTTSEGANAPQKFLLCRRLIEARVGVVRVSISDFETHSINFPRMQNLVPIVDQGLAAFVTDLHQRGLWGDVVVVV